MKNRSVPLYQSVELIRCVSGTCDYSISTVGSSTATTSQISVRSLWHIIEPPSPAHNSASGMMHAPTIVGPPRPKIRAPAPPLVAPPANLLIRPKNSNPKPKWMQRPSMLHTALPPVLTDDAPIEAPSPHRLPPSGPTTSLRRPLIRIPLAALAHRSLLSQVPAVGSTSLEENKIVSTTAGSSRPSIVVGGALRPQARCTVVSITAASSHPSIVAGLAVPAHNPTPVRRTDTSTPEQWLEIWKHCWKICSEIIHEPGCSRSDYDYAMMVFQQLAEYEWDRPVRVRKSHPVTVEEPRLARWRSPSPSRSRSPLSPQDPSSHRASSSRSRSPATLIL